MICENREPLKLMYITNRPEVAVIAQDAGVDRIFVDMEYIGKEARQAGLDTVKSHHTIEDVKKIRKAIHKSDLLVRINPVHDKSEEYCSTEDEVDDAIAAGADILMLPMYKTATEVKRFLCDVDGRAKTMLLLETIEAVECLNEILTIEGIDEIHIGLNDLHLAYGLDFMFQLLSNGMIKALCDKIKERNIPFGFGGIARVGYGDLPAEYIIAEHYSLGSQMAILSRGFCNAANITDMAELKRIFDNGVAGIRDFEKQASAYSDGDFVNNHAVLCDKVQSIVERRKHK